MQSLAIGGFAAAAAFVFAATVSEERVTDCRTAEIAWQSTAALRAKAAARAAPPPAFFCASSAALPGLGLCARQQPVCVQARNAAVGAVPDLAVCAAESSAWCFGAGDVERCAAMQQACMEQRARWPMTVPASATRCGDRRAARCGAAGRADFPASNEVEEQEAADECPVKPQCAMSSG